VAISWQGVEHFFASGFRDLLVGARAVASRQTQIDNAASKVEQVTAGVAIFFPPALEALEIERVAVFALGVGCMLIRKFGSVDAAAKAMPDVHPDLWSQLTALLAQYPQLIQQAEQLFPGGAK
jgi:hypothetical protein